MPAEWLERDGWLTLREENRACSLLKAEAMELAPKQSGRPVALYTVRGFSRQRLLWSSDRPKTAPALGFANATCLAGRRLGPALPVSLVWKRMPTQRYRPTGPPIGLGVAAPAFAAARHQDAVQGLSTRLRWFAARRTVALRSYLDSSLPWPEQNV